MIKNPSDFIGHALGYSEEKTRAILEATMGQVLIIDEAYGLDPGSPGSNVDSYKAAVLDTIVAEVQGLAGDDRCILMLGYEDRLRTMFKNANPGLARRFALEDPFIFQDYNLPQLNEILHQKLKEQDLKATPEALTVASGVLSRARMRPDFSNVGDVEACLNRAKNNFLSRQASKKSHEQASDGCLEPGDFDPEFNRANEAACCRIHLQNKVSESIIKQLENLQKIALNARRHGLEPGDGVPMGFIFKGPAGKWSCSCSRTGGFMTKCPNMVTNAYCYRYGKVGDSIQHGKSLL